MHKSFLYIFFCLLVGGGVLTTGCAKKLPTETETPPEASAEESSAEQQGSESVPDPILVTVNNQNLRRSEAAEMARAMAARQGVPPQMMEAFMQQAGPQLEQQAITQFVDRSLVREEVQRRDLAVSEAEVSNVIEEISGSLPEGMTLDQALASRGTTMEAFEADIVENERMRKLFEEETEGVLAVTDEQIATFYGENEQHFKKNESVQASHILIRCKDDASEEDHAQAKAQAEAVRQKLVDGGDFAELAKAESSCPSKDKGGDLGSFGRGQMVPEFEAAAFSQEIGTIGPVVKTSFGYHVIKVTDKTEATVQPIEEASDQIREHLSNQAKHQKFGDYLESLRERADITYAEGYAPAGE